MTMRTTMTDALLALACAAILLLLPLASCDRSGGDGGGGGGGAASGGKPRVALVMKSLENPFFRTMQEGAEAHARANADAYELTSTGIKNETDVDRQIQLVEQIVARGVDAIVLAPADSKALVPVCKKARDAGIIVINIDNKLDAAALADKGLSIPFVGPDNKAGAKLAGDHLAGKLKAGDEVAIVEGVPGAFNAVQRKAGFEAAMAAVGAKVVSSQSAQWERDPAVRVASAVLNNHPDLKAILCANDEMALGVHTAVRDANKLGKVLIVGFDNIPAVQALIRKGEVLCTVDQHADQIAVGGIQYALEVLKTKATPVDKRTPVDLVTAETLSK